LEFDGKLITGNLEIFKFFCISRIEKIGQLEAIPGRVSSNFFKFFGPFHPKLSRNYQLSKPELLKYAGKMQNRHKIGGPTYSQLQN
jgi:hypothetical protein